MRVAELLDELLDEHNLIGDDIAPEGGGLSLVEGEVLPEGPVRCPVPFALWPHPPPPPTGGSLHAPILNRIAFYIGNRK